MGRRPAPVVMMAAGTVVSRVTGFARTAALAAALGLSVTADAFNAASSVPTMLLVLVTGGTLSAAIVPLLSAPESPEDRKRVAGYVVVAVAAVAGAGSLLMAATAPALSHLFAAAAPPETATVRAERTQLFLLLLSPQVLLLGLLVATNGLLTAAGRLGRVGFTPIINNVVAVAGIGAYVAVSPGPSSPTGLVLLGASSTVAAAAATGSQLLACRDLLPAPRRLLRTDRGVRRALLRVGRWSILYVAANQVGLFVTLVVAGRQTGAVSAYQWSFALMQLPYAVFAVPILSAMIPRLTRLREQLPAFEALVGRGAALLAALLVPAGAGLALFSDVVATALLVGGDPDEVRQLASGIRLFAVALLPFVAFQLLTRLSYVLDEPAWPALVNLAVNLTTLTGSGIVLTLAGDDQVLTGLSVSYAASYVVGSVVLGRLVRARVPVGVSAQGLRRSVLLVTSGALLAVGARLLLPGRWGVALALGGFLACAALSVWPWRRAAARLSEA